MDKRRDFEVVPQADVPPVPRAFSWFVRALTPQTPKANGDFILNDLWKRHPRVREALPRVPAAIAPVLFSRVCDSFYLKLAVVQMCILFMPFAGVLSPPLLLILGLTFSALIVREAYVPPGERLECEFITMFMTPAVILLLYVAMSWAFPGRLLSPEALTPRLVALSLPIGFFRYHYAPGVTPESPYRDLLRLHYRVWFFNDLWIAAAITYLFTTEQAAPAAWFFRGFLTVNPAVLFFTTAVRMQLNPLGGAFRHRRIFGALFTNPHQEEIRMKRDYLLTGADWTRNFSVQSLYEILSFAFGLSPLVIGVVEWYIGDPNAARISWIQMAANFAAWIVLLATWPLLKRMNRETAVPFDKTIKTFPYRWAVVRAA